MENRTLFEFLSRLRHLAERRRFAALDLELAD
jgi:hypothetical protein